MVFNVTMLKYPTSLAIKPKFIIYQIYYAPCVSGITFMRNAEHLKVRNAEHLKIRNAEHLKIRNAEHLKIGKRNNLDLCSYS